MRNCIPFLAALLLPSCVLLENPVSLGRSRSETMGDGLRKSQHETEAAPDTSAHLYLAAVEYPNDYDWVRDTAHATVEARLLLFKDGEGIAAFPAGDAHHVSTDPDTHWILGGHLYTTFCDGLSTYIHMDGTPLYQFNGAEDIRGILLKDGFLWSLGVKLRGSGFVLRCNGEAVIDNSQGSLIGSLYEDDGDICFAYGLSVNTSGYTIRKYYLAAGGEEKEVAIPSDASAVFDIRRIGGITWSTYRQPRMAVTPILSSDSSSKLLYGDITGVTSVEWCEIMPCGDDIRIKGCYVSPLYGTFYVLWNTAGIQRSYVRTIVINDIYSDEDGRFGAVGYDSEKDLSVLFLPPNGSSRVDLDRRYRFISSRCAAIVGGKLYAAFSGDGEDVLCINGVRTTLAINGPVTVLAYQ